MAKGITEPKFRHELKYLCSSAELKMLEVRLQNVMKPDPHTNESGCYLIRSTYFDDLYDRCLNENESGVSPREKWRVRIYNASDRRISLECKRKEYGMIQKKSCRLTREQTERMMDLDFIPVTGQNLPLISRGGSSMLINCCYIGMMLSISRYVNKKQEIKMGIDTPENEKSMTNMYYNDENMK